MKYFAISFFSLLLYPILSFAQVPTQTIWSQPENAAPGEPIELNAFVYNTEKEEVTFTVSFQTKGKNEIASSSAQIAPQVAKAIVAQWKQPKDPTEITAVIVKAVGKNGKEIPSLHGELATITVGVPEKKDTKSITFPHIAFPKKQIIIDFFETNFVSLEKFRQEQAEYFIDWRDDAKEKSGINTKREIVQDVPLDVPGGETVTQLTPIEDPNFVTYAKVIIGSALASLFNNKLIFYVTFSLLVFGIIRALVRRFI